MPLLVNRTPPDWRLLESHALHAHDSVRYRSQSRELAAVGPDHVGVVEIDDRPILEHDGGEIAVGGGALPDVAGAARPGQDGIDLGLAITGDVDAPIAADG